MNFMRFDGKKGYYFRQFIKLLNIKHLAGPGPCKSLTRKGLCYYQAEFTASAS
jgi:hypothetical protein